MIERNHNSRLKIKSSTEEGARKERLDFLEAKSDIKLNHLQHTDLTCKDVNGNIESFIGTIEVPVGLAGPIKMKHSNGDSEFIYAPVATSEGALVASMTRGAYAINLSGGFNYKVIRQRMSRCPMFCFNTMADADQFCDWIRKNYTKVKKETHKYSNYANLVELEPQLYGRNVHLRFDYETGDASGQNMTTTCTWNACLWIEESYNKTVDEQQSILNYVIEANGSSDKKVTARSKLSTRGLRVITECFLPEKVINKVLKTGSQDIIDLYLKANPVAVNDGMIGYNVNVANAVAAFFASTGQDLACIHESSVAIMQVEKTPEGLYIAITLPSLVIGTIGGGTGLKGPQEILKIMNCQGSEKVERLAGIIAGYALGLELSTMSAITSGQFATSHERLGRNRPVDILREHELNLNFFTNHLNITGLEQVQRSEQINIQNGIVSEVTSKVSKKPIGFYPFKLTKHGKEFNSVLKVKPLDDEILMGFEIIAGLVSPDLKQAYGLWKTKNAFIQSHVKEIDAYKSLNHSHPHFIPKYYGSTKIIEREIYAISKEYLDESQLTHFNSENSPETWKTIHKEAVVNAISEIHGDYFDTQNHFASEQLTATEKVDLIPFYKEVITQAEKALPWFDKNEFNWFNKIIDNIPKWYAIYSQSPKTLIHNDFSPRNICLRENGTPCIYDWELCEVSPPQRDFIEFMAFTQSGSFDALEFENLSKLHYNNFVKLSELSLTFSDWKKGLMASSYEFLVDRLSFYMIGNIINQYKFLNRVYKSTRDMIEYMENEY